MKDTKLSGSGGPATELLKPGASARGPAGSPRRAKANAKTDPTAVEPDVASRSESEADETRGFSLAAFWRGSSSWLVSAVFHAIVLLVLALTWISLQPKEKDRFLMANIDGQELEDLEDSTLEDQLEDIELEQADALPVKLEDPGIAALGEAVGIDSEAVVDVGAMSISNTMGEIGTLFGKDGKGWSNAGEGLGGAEFYGVKASGKKFVFIVDNSLSMNQGRFEAACFELYKSVCKMTPYQSFYVYFFSDTAYPLFHPRPADGWVKASIENKTRLKSWLPTVDLVLRTDAKKAVMGALALKPDAIYILTDGVFTDSTHPYLMSQVDPRQTRVSIHTVGMELNKAGAEKGLREISARHNGTYRAVTVDPRLKQMVGKGSRPRHNTPGPVWGIALGDKRPGGAGKQGGPKGGRPGGKGKNNKNR